MKLLGIIFLLSTSVVYSQQPVWLADAGQFGKVLEAPRGIQVNGSPYLLDSWMQGLVDYNNYTYRIPKMKFNILKGHIEYEESGKLFFLEPHQFKSFVLLKGKDSVLFKNGISGVKEIGIKEYVQVVLGGKNEWICKYSANLIDDPDAPYGGQKLKMIKQDKSYFFIKPNQKGVRLKLTKNYFVKTFKLNAMEFDAYLNKMNLSFDDEIQLKMIFLWLDRKN